MTFEITEDLALVRAILTEPLCWRKMCDDFAPAPENFTPSVRGNLVYVIARRRYEVVALFVLVTNFRQAEVHFCITPQAWGRERTVRIGREFLQWVWENTALDWLLGPVPSHNKLALRLARECGFTDFAEERGCVTKGGKTYDRILLQVKRPDRF